MAHQLASTHTADAEPGAFDDEGTLLVTVTDEEFTVSDLAVRPRRSRSLRPT